MTDLAKPTPTADELRVRLVEGLLAADAITTPAVEAAFRAVPREAFAPAGTALTAAYADDVVITKRRPDGKATSSVSASWLQARMITSRLTHAAPLTSCPTRCPHCATENGGHVGDQPRRPTDSGGR